MTSVDVVFRYGQPPGEPEMRALDNLREVYGIRRILFKEQDRTVIGDETPFWHGSPQRADRS